MIIGFADHEGGAVNDKYELDFSIGPVPVTTQAKNGSFSAEYDGDLTINSWHRGLAHTYGRLSWLAMVGLRWMVPRH